MIPLRSGADPSPAPFRLSRRGGYGKQKETFLSQQRTRGIRDGISRGREWDRRDRRHRRERAGSEKQNSFAADCTIRTPDAAWDRKAETSPHSASHPLRRSAKLVIEQLEIEPRGLKPGGIKLYRRHKCLLHPVTLGGKSPFSSTRTSCEYI